MKDGESIDALYGLEPVFEPDRAPADGTESIGVQVQAVQCPYCGETFETSLDLSAGSTHYVEDCQVCCQPIEFSLQVDHAGQLVNLTTSRDAP
ncbi:MAG TPA: CPXCG motif-containing cysteine-rich protein [Steroidobacteraceae bacterium]